jgi:hypothetical protein
MKIYPLVLAVVFLAGNTASAQNCSCGAPAHGGFAGGSGVGGGGGAGGGITSGGVVAPWVVSAVPDPSPVFPYSYFAASPGPARVYVLYSDQDTFPFGGRPYGHVYDRWGWSSMGSSTQNSLARYFYPPVR